MLMNVYHPDCPSHRLLDAIGNKWSILCIEILAAEPHHFGALRRRMQGISAKVLSTVLQRLLAHGFITRCELQDARLRVEYALSEKGRELATLCHAITAFAVRHADGIDNPACTLVR